MLPEKREKGGVRADLANHVGRGKDGGESYSVGKRREGGGGCGLEMSPIFGIELDFDEFALLWFEGLFWRKGGKCRGGNGRYLRRVRHESFLNMVHWHHQGLDTTQEIFGHHSASPGNTWPHFLYLL